MQSIDQNQLCSNDGGSLKVDSLPAAIVETFHIQERRLNVCSGLRHEPFEVGEEWRVVERPF